MNVFLFFSKVIMYRKKCVWHKVFPFLFTTLVGRFSLRYLFSELCLIYARDTVTHVGVKCPVLLPEFYQNWIVSANFSNISHYKWHENPFSRLSLWRCGQRRCSNGFESFTGVDMCLFVLPCRPASCLRNVTRFVGLLSELRRGPNVFHKNYQCRLRWSVLSSPVVKGKR